MLASEWERVGWGSRGIHFMPGELRWERIRKVFCMRNKREGNKRKMTGES